MRILAASAAILVAVVAAVPAQAASNDPRRAQQWGLDMVNADPAHSVTTGRGALVAVVDTGVFARHEDLRGRLLRGHDFVQKDRRPQDGNGHGTHVSGIVVATANNGRGGEGAAPGARVLPVRVLGNDGSGSANVVAKGIDYAVDQGADVINLSLGDLPVASSALGENARFVAAISRANRAGVVVAAAAGNDSLPLCEQPSVRGQILCVGAVDRRGLRSFFSSSGNVMAPGGSALGGSGEDILSTYNNGGYEDLAGTSQATPFVSAVAALLASRGVFGGAAVSRILGTARDAGLPGPDPMFGNGIVDARAAVSGLPASALSVRVTRRQATRAALRRGVRLRCRPSRSGRCTARARARGKLVASGSRHVRGGRTSFVTARVTRAGRRALRRSSVRASLTVRVPGVGRVGRRLVFVR